MLQGNNVYLRLMEERDVPYKVKWVNNSEFRRTLNFNYPVSEISTKQWLSNVSNNATRADFIVCTNEKDEPIGYCGFLSIDYKNSKAESYMGIGSNTHRGKGIGYEVRVLLLNYAFQELGLNKIYAYVWKDNLAMLNLNKKVGFEIEGLLKEDIFSHGELRDRYILSIFKKDFIKSKESLDIDL